MTEEDNMRVAINRTITKHWPKMVKDSQRICSYNADQWADDLLAFHITEFVTKKPLAYQYKVCCIDNKLPNYMGKAMSLGLRSSASPFWLQIRKPMYNNRELFDSDDGKYDYGPEFTSFINDEFDTAKQNLSPEDCVEWALSQLHFYDRALIEQYYFEGKTYNEIKDYYNIPHSSVVKDIKLAVKKLKKHCNHFIA